MKIHFSKNKLKLLLFISIILFFIIGGIYMMIVHPYEPPKFYASLLQEHNLKGLISIKRG